VGWEESRETSGKEGEEGGTAPGEEQREGDDGSAVRGTAELSCLVRAESKCQTQKNGFKSSGRRGGGDEKKVAPLLRPLPGQAQPDDSAE
jgi:hypothetical protein